MANDNKTLIDAIHQRERAYSEAIDRLRELASGSALSEGEVSRLAESLREAVEIARCCRRLVAKRTVQEIHKAFGAPGDFGYETPIGDALALLYSEASARVLDRARLETSTPVGVCATCGCSVSAGELCCRKCGPPRMSAVAPFFRPEAEKVELRPRLDALAAKLCQTQPYILGALEASGLTVVLLRSPDARPEGTPTTKRTTEGGT